MIWALIGTLFFVVLPIAAARTGRRRNLLAGVLATVGGTSFLMFSCSRMALEDVIPEGKVERDAFLKGAKLQLTAATPFASLLMGSTIGLLLLATIPKPEIGSKDDDAA